MAEGRSAGTPDDGLRDVDQEQQFADRVFTSLYEIFWAPEVERRGGVDAVGPLSKALAIMMPGEPLAVLLNDEAQLVGRAVSTRAIETGEVLRREDVGQILDLFPYRIHEDAGWACMVVLPTGEGYASFDFRRNRGLARDRLDRAVEFLDIADVAAGRGLSGPAVDAAHAAAELAVSAMAMILETDGPALGRGRNSHGKRQGWITQWARLGNAPSEFARALGRLGQLRAPARYADRQLNLSDGELDVLVSTVRAMVAHASESVGPHRQGPGV